MLPNVLNIKYQTIPLNYFMQQHFPKQQYAFSALSTVNLSRCQGGATIKDETRCQDYLKINRHGLLAACQDCPNINAVKEPLSQDIQYILRHKVSLQQCSCSQCPLEGAQLEK